MLDVSLCIQASDNLARSFNAHAQGLGDDLERWIDAALNGVGDVLLCAVFAFG
jgi:hypothetical protein